MNNTRKEVLAEIADVIRAAQDQGVGDSLAVARSTFPGVPEMVLAEAWMEVETSRVETWWQGVERTIDGAVIRSAITAVEGDAE